MDRNAEIDRIVEDVLRRRQAGEDVSFEDVERQHRHLLPELRRRLATLRAIEVAAECATAQPESGDVDGPTDAMLLGESLAGYEVIERVRRGGQGVIFKAMQLSTNRTVAIKVLLDGPFATGQQRHRFSREVELIARLRHPNIVTVYDSGIVNGRPYFAMEYVDGMSIDDYILLHGLSGTARVELFATICRAVSFAHQRGIIHRDLKPSNILVDDDGEPHILDFGLAKDYSPTGGSGSSTSISMTGQVVGTLPYLSPEQARGAVDDVDVRSDIYSLGVVLYEILTGSFPYPVEGAPLDVQNNIVGREPIPPRKALSDESLDGGFTRREMSGDLEAILLKTLEKDKGDRYQSVAALAEDLGRYLAGDAVEAKSANAFYVLGKTIRRFRLQVAIAAAFLLLVIGSAVGMGILWQRAETQRQRAETQARIYQAGLQMGSYLKLGAVERDEGRLEQAMAMFEKALELAGDDVAGDPVVDRYRIGAHHRIGTLLLEEGKLDEAEPHFQSLMSLAEELVRREPENLEWQRSLADALASRARLAMARDEWEFARRDLQKVVSTRRALLGADPDNASLSFELAVALGQDGESRQGTRAFGEAIQCYSAAREILQMLYQADPDSLDYTIELSRTEARIAIGHLFLHDPELYELARDLLERAERRVLGLVESGKSAPRSRDVSTTLRDVRAVLEYLARREAEFSNRTD